MLLDYVTVLTTDVNLKMMCILIRISFAIYKLETGHRNITLNVTMHVNRVKNRHLKRYYVQ